jgi:hypothetical protein
MPMKLWAVVAGVLIGVTMAAGCSSDSSDSSSKSSSTTSGRRAVCAAWTDLVASVEQLTSSATLTGGKSAISDALGQVNDDLSAVRAAAGKEVRQNVTAAERAVDELQTTIRQIQGDSISAGLQEVGTAIAKVGSSAGAVVSGLDPTCRS